MLLWLALLVNKTFTHVQEQTKNRLNFFKNQYRGGACLKRELGQFVNLREGLARKKGVGMGGREGISQCTLCNVSQQSSVPNCGDIPFLGKSHHPFAFNRFYFYISSLGNLRITIHYCYWTIPLQLGTLISTICGFTMLHWLSL